MTTTPKILRKKVTSSEGSVATRSLTKPPMIAKKNDAKSIKRTPLSIFSIFFFKQPSKFLEAYHKLTHLSMSFI
jgi:hypothetical protein